MSSGAVCGAALGRIFQYLRAFSRFSIGRAAKIELGVQSTFLHGIGSKSG
jgi:hypothetical protein